MEELKVELLEIFSKSESKLTYYQLDRKLSNRNMHDFIPKLRFGLDELVSEGFIEESMSEKGSSLYKISDKGIEKLKQKGFWKKLGF